MTIDDRGLAILGSAIVMALAISMGFGAAVIVERNHYIHQVKLSQQKVNRKAHERLDLTATRNPDNTVISVANAGSAPVAFDYLLLRQPDNRVVAGPASWPESLVGWWRFSEGSGNTAYDYSGNGNDGTLHGDPEWVDGWAGDGALRFDGTDWIGIPGFPDLQTDFTISARIETSNNAEAGQRVFADDESNTGGYALSLGDPGTGALRFYSRNMNAVSLDTTTGIIANYKEYHVVAEADISNNNRFILVGSELKAEFFSDAGTWGTDSGKASIGGETDLGESANRFVGTIEDVQIYRRALDPDEISQLNSYNVLIDPIGLNPLESYSVTYPYRIKDDVTVGVYTQLGNIFWGKR